ncbi:3'-5' exonuclease domain-containing protein 2 [Acinetobacter sp. ANC 5380]|uniref:3'-5' exonuclease domain-containing protein 2 n=1 Tax=Acinetobacter terrae TaxID=2731247 RepID=A0A7Y2WA37_9GAMM|nr:3'-5' exonuclease [Acinetobacter terrae]NNH14974.1 3'-5' exonuclease domain-containing protein 2 [Acinetobacter terrae]NNH76897.1 3'-5' exonuclease domain-containing protein 2 [Acinetobacter terrae]
MEELLLQTLPSKEQIQEFPIFQNLPLHHIHLINSIEQCLALEQELKSCALLGFDTESKPTFAKGEVSTGPHLIQLASCDKAYLFQINPEILEFLKAVFENRDQVKVGFGLKNDAHLFRKKGIELNSVIELSKCFSAFGFPNPMGLKNAMALLFQLNFPKSKKISTSNWARKILTPPQIQYAAADAYAPVLVFEELLRLGLLPKHIPNTSLKLRIRPNKIKAETDA